MNHLLVPVDGSDDCYKALHLALDLAEHHDAAITLLHVTPTRDVPAALRQFAQVEHMENGAEWLYDKTIAERLLASARKHAEGRKPRALQVSVQSGDAAGGICRAVIDLDADTIVMGSRGLSEVGGLVMGSVSRKVGHAAPCTVITVR